MCIGMTFSKKSKKKMLSKLPNGLFTVYKVVERENGSYHPVCYSERYKVGLNTARNGEIYNLSCLWGFHSFKTKSAAKKLFRGIFNQYNKEIIKFRIRKSWIKEIGREHNGCICYVTDRIISPSLRDKSAIVI